MKHAYLCCKCSRACDDRPIHNTCRVCKGLVVHVPTWEREMAENARQIRDKLDHLRIVRAGK
jgi:hypothetical protein